MPNENQKYLLKVSSKRKSLTDRFSSMPEEVFEIITRYVKEGKLEVETEIAPDGLEVTQLMYFESSDVYNDYHEEMKKTLYSIEKEYVKRQETLEESFEVVGYVDYFSQNTP